METTRKVSEELGRDAYDNAKTCHWSRAWDPTRGQSVAATTESPHK